MSISEEEAEATLTEFKNLLNNLVARLSSLEAEHALSLLSLNHRLAKMQYETLETAQRMYDRPLWLYSAARGIVDYWDDNFLYNNGRSSNAVAEDREGTERERVETNWGRVDKAAAEAREKQRARVRSWQSSAEETPS